MQEMNVSLPQGTGSTLTKKSRVPYTCTHSALCSWRLQLHARCLVRYSHLFVLCIDFPSAPRARAIPKHNVRPSSYLRRTMNAYHAFEDKQSKYLEKQGHF